jgi:ADP-ribosylglycohydrolase
MTVDAMDRALGALAGVAIGDAMGMPTQTLTRERIAETYGAICDFTDAAASHPVSAGLKAATITDDTEQSLLLARHLIARKGHVDQEAWARELVAWERDTHARGVNDLLGPSTKRAIEALLRGVPVSETGQSGTTNGAAMRIIPVGIATPPEPLSKLVDAVADSCRLTHNTADAIAAAAAVAAMVSRGIDGARFEEGLAFALAAAKEGELRGAPATSSSMADHIEAALARAEGRTGQAAAIEIASIVGTSVASWQSVPMAFAVARLAGGDPWKAALMSAVIGDDTDTIGAISCGMAGACSGLAMMPQDKWQRVRDANGLDLDPIAKGLLAIRRDKTR